MRAARDGSHARREKKDEKTLGETKKKKKKINK